MSKKKRTSGDQNTFSTSRLFSDVPLVRRNCSPSVPSARPNCAPSVPSERWNCAPMAPSASNSKFCSRARCSMLLGYYTPVNKRTTTVSRQAPMYQPPHYEVFGKPMFHHNCPWYPNPSLQKQKFYTWKIISKRKVITNIELNQNKNKPRTNKWSELGWVEILTAPQPLGKQE